MRTLVAASVLVVGLAGAAATQLAKKPAPSATTQSAAVAMPDASAAPDSPVAIVAGAPITRAQLQEHLGNRLFAVRTSEYEMEKDGLEEMIANRLFEQEAARRKITVPQLLAAEVEAKVPAVSDDETRARYEAVKDRIKDRAAADVMAEIGSSLRAQRLAIRREAFSQELMAKAGVQLLLEPPRARVALTNEPYWGPATAPVTVVEFADFQCPYCARVAPTLKSIRDRYGDKVRLVYQYFPLSFHANAAKAAEAAACAGDQGKFWEMHDKILERQSQIGVDDLKKNAADLGLNAAAFAKCLDSGTKAADIQRGLETGATVGVTGTPAFLINGRLLTGARPLEHFTAIIDEELARAQQAPGASAAGSR